MNIKDKKELPTGGSIPLIEKVSEKLDILQDKITKLHSKRLYKTHYKSIREEATDILEELGVITDIHGFMPETDELKLKCFRILKI